MALSQQSIENLIDLVENKVSTMEVFNEDDARDIEILAATWSELVTQLADRKAMRGRLSVLPVDPLRNTADRAVA